MAWIGRGIRLIVIFGVLFFAGIFVYKYYPWIFSKRVSGKIVDVQRVTQASAIINSQVTDAQIHSYSVLILGDDGKLYAASSEDRQWQVAAKGYCCEAVFYRYPFWNLEKSGTFYNARLKELRLCPGETKAPEPNAPTMPLPDPLKPQVDAPSEPNK